MGIRQRLMVCHACRFPVFVKQLMFLLGCAAACAVAVAEKNPPISVSVSAPDGRVETGKILRVKISTPARSDAGNLAQPPAVWIDGKPAVFQPGSAECQQTAERLLRGGIVPAVRDLNIVHIATMGADGTLHVLDPRGGIRGARSVARLSLTTRPGPWALDSGRSKLLIALPEKMEIAVIDTVGWTRSSTLKISAAPNDMLLDDRRRTLHVLVGGARAGLASFKLDDYTQTAFVPIAAASIRLVPDRGGNPLVLSAHGLLRVNGQTTTLVQDGVQDAVYSSLADAHLLVLDHGELRWIGADGAAASLGSAGKGTRFQVALSSDQQYAFTYATDGDAVAIIDLATRQIVRTLEVPQPSAIAFSDQFAFLRSSTRGDVLVFPLLALRDDGAASGRWISGGNPLHAADGAKTIVAAPAGAAFWIDHKENVVYAYHEGMNAVSGTLRHPGFAPERLMLVGPLVERVSDGEFAGSFQLDVPGEYVAVVRGFQPPFTRCKVFTVRGSDLSPDRQGPRITVKPVVVPQSVKASETFGVELSLQGAESLPGLIGLIFMSADGTWQIRAQAQRADNQHYRAQLSAPRPGPYLLVVDSLGLQRLGKRVFPLEVTP